MNLQRAINAVVRKRNSYFVVECLELRVVTQGETLDETISNLYEAIELQLEGEDLAKFGLVPNPTLIVTMEPYPLQNSFMSSKYWC